MSECLLKVELSAGYRKQSVLTDVRFNLHRGERLALLGSSGAGKSTLLLALLGLLPHHGGWVQGAVTLLGHDLLRLKPREARHLRGRDIALVPQSPLSALNPALSLLSHFQAAWKAHQPSDPVRLRQRMYDLAARVGVPCDPAFFARKPGQISVGQAQRCVLALAMLHRPAVLIADECTSALDPITQTEVLQLLREICDEDGTGLLFVSHDLLSVFRLCTAVSLLHHGQLGPKLTLEEVPEAGDPVLQRYLRALPVPASLLLKFPQTSPAATHGDMSQQVELQPLL